MGSTRIEAWIPPQVFPECSLGPHREDEGVFFRRRDRDSCLFRLMILPLTKMAIKGVIWYQGLVHIILCGTFVTYLNCPGEGNALKRYHVDRYSCSFPALVRTWRARWAEDSRGATGGDLPFGFVQLASNREDKAGDPAFPLIRWRQTADYGFAPNHKLPVRFTVYAIMKKAMTVLSFSEYLYGGRHRHARQGPQYTPKEQTGCKKKSRIFCKPLSRFFSFRLLPTGWRWPLCIR